MSDGHLVRTGAWGGQWSAWSRRLMMALALLSPPWSCAPAGEGQGSPQSSRLVVFAAASLIDAMGEIGSSYEQSKGVAVQLSFGASGTLARQIASGAPADVFLSADVRWVDWLIEQDLCAADTRRVILGNSLVVIAPSDSDLALQDLAGLDGLRRLALANTRTAPAGRYAKQALENSGMWRGLQGRIVETESVRGALLLVERGEADAGLVYASDARASDRVKVVLPVPQELHDRVEFAAVATLSPGDLQAKRRFLGYLQSAEARSVFARRGFLGGR